MTTIRVLLVDDQELVRTGIRLVLRRKPEITVVGEAADGKQALELLAEVETDVVVMDIRMPGMDGLEATKRICAMEGPKVLILTTFDLDDYVFGALKAGASGFLLKDTGPQAFTEAIKIVHRGESVLAPSATRLLVSHFVAHQPSRPAQAPDRRAGLLSRREREVLAEIAIGLSNAEIAARMFLSEGTVRTHISHILAKLGLRDRVQAVIFAYENGLIKPG
ncbi:response regulator [Nonomuraea cavernae]|uniref:DNA-binding response regulator n=1 Tax=Nonomuraea cavernae TaxID=2045107 RepID=A0A917YQF2_9ACTN|nr:response regulator transcription factor [Nonomuraea cavernae]MCA2184420.1 response regulator transcription factor [Nonomuraea cavernae]GGO63855.1 DNA-binding response regulator [Nonomuraea cavernae]